MLRTILIDDQKKSRRVLEELLRTYFPQVEIVAMAESAEEGLKFIKELKPDLILLDIEMPEQTGFDMLRNIPHIDFDIIFVTAHNQYALKAIKFSALDYLLKPVDLEELRDAIQKVEKKRKHHNKSVINSQLDALYSYFNNTHSTSKRIGLTTLDGLVFVETNDIVRIEAEDHFSIVTQNKGGKILVLKSLKDFEILLKDFNFFRVHKSHVINLSHIRQVKKNTAPSIVMNDNTIIPIAREIKNELLKHLSIV